MRQRNRHQNPVGPVGRVLRGLGLLALTVSALVLGIVVVGPLTGQFRFVPVVSGSMGDAAPKGSAAFVRPIDVDDIEVGDVVLFHAPIEGSPLVVHRVIDITEKDGERLYQTQGDANEDPDPWRVRMTGSETWKMRGNVDLPYAGEIGTALRSPEVRLPVLIVGIMLVLVLGFRRIWFPPDGPMDGAVVSAGSDPDPDPELAGAHSSRRVRVGGTGQVIGLGLGIVLLLATPASALFTSVESTGSGVYSSGLLVAPTGLKCAWTGTSNIAFDWTGTGPGFTNGYALERANASGGPYSTIATTVGHTSTSANDVALAPPGPRYYVTRSTHSTWTSPDSNEVISNECERAINTIVGTGTAGFSGDGGPATSAQLNQPRGVAVHPSGDIYVADTTNNRIRRIDTAGVITTFVGGGGTTGCGYSGAATGVSLRLPRDVDVDPTTGDLIIADTNRNCVRRVTVPGGVVSRVAGGGATTSCGYSGAATGVRLTRPNGVAVDGTGAVYIADTNRNCVRKVTGTTVAQLAGGGGSTACGYSGAATGVSLDRPRDVAMDPTSGDVIIADTNRNCVRRASGTTVSRVAGGGGTTSCTFAGGAANVRLSRPMGVGVDSSGVVFIADTNRNCLRTVTSTTMGQVAGTGTAGFTNEGGYAGTARVNRPERLAFDAVGNLLFPDGQNQRIRRIQAPLS